MCSPNFFRTGFALAVPRGIPSWVAQDLPEESPQGSNTLASVSVLWRTTSISGHLGPQILIVLRSSVIGKTGASHVKFNINSIFPQPPYDLSRLEFLTSIEEINQYLIQEMKNRKTLKLN